MIPIPHGWAVEHVDSTVTLTHPRGREVAVIEYRERAGAPRRLGSLVASIVNAWPRRRALSVGPVERLSTTDGEVAAMLTVACAEDGRALDLHLGFVFTDDFYSSTAITSWRESSEMRFLLRELITNDSHALGVRRRRFEYEPPPSWQPIKKSLATEWIPPDFPSHDVTILVYPANPIAVVGRATFGSAHHYLEELGWEVLDAKAIERGTTRRNLAFEAQEITARRGGQVRYSRIVVPSDSRYQYPVELRANTANSMDREVLDRLVHSIVPFGQRGEVSAGLVQHWLD